MGEAADLTEEVRPVPLALLCHLPPWSRVPSFVVLGRCEDGVKDERVEAGIEEVVY